MLEETDYGNEGLVYRHGNVAEKAALLPDPYFCTMRKGDKLMASLALSHREAMMQGQSYRSYYIRYFSFLDAVRRPEAHQPDRKPMRAGNRLLRPLIWSMFDRTDPADPKVPEEPTLYYAYVEAENQRSYEMCQTFGFSPLRTMTTVPFSRAYPKARKEVQPLPAEERPVVVERIKEYYKDYSLVTLETVFANNHYYVWRENGEIIGGVQAYPITWQFHDLPGMMGTFTMRVVPHLPVLGRLFNPKNYRFAAIEGLWCAEGREDILLPMVESALAQEQLTVAMFFVDKHGPLHKTLSQAGRLGLMHTMNGEVDSQIIGRFVNSNPQDESRFKHTPAYIAAFDCT